MMVEQEATEIDSGSAEAGRLEIWQRRIRGALDTIRGNMLLRLGGKIGGTRFRLNNSDGTEVWGVDDLGQQSNASKDPISNNLVQRNVNGLIRANDYYVHAYATGTITMTSGSWKIIPWTALRDSNASMWISEYPNRIWAPVDGWIDVDAVIQIPATSGMIGAYFRANSVAGVGGTQIHEQSHASGTLGSALNPHMTYPFRAGDWFETFALQTTGSNKNITVTNYLSPEIRAVYRQVNLNPTVGTQKYIMACGDSKTAISDGRWRIYMQDILMAANKRVGWVGAVNGRDNGDPVGMQSYHSAVSGATTATIRTLVANAVITQAPDIVTIWLGTNDLRAGTSLATIQTSYTGMITDIFARWPSCTIVCCTVEQNYAPDSPVYAPAALNAWIATLPATYGAQLKVADTAALMNFSTLYAGDGLHVDGPRGNWLAAWCIYGQIKTLVG